MTEQYLLFAGSKYYPNGGMADLIGQFPSLEEAKQFFDEGWTTRPFQSALPFGIKWTESDEDIHWAHIMEVSSTGVRLASEWDMEPRTPPPGSRNIQMRWYDTEV